MTTEDRLQMIRVEFDGSEESAFKIEKTSGSTVLMVDDYILVLLPDRTAKLNIGDKLLIERRLIV